MGMSIDEAITALERDIHNARLCGHQIDQYKVAIATMRRYQKIQEIMNELNGNFYGSYLKDRQTLEKIYEVVEDGET